MQERPRQLKDIILDFLYPPIHHCIYCGTEKNLASENLCEECKKLEEKLEISQAMMLEKYEALSLFRYEGIVKDLIHRMKFGKNSYLTRYMASQLAERMKRDNRPVDFLTFVPIHKSRFRVREFDQSEKICKFLAVELEIPYGKVIKKVKGNKPQSSLHKTERKQNVKDVYHLEPKWEGKLEGKVVYLIDDVLTTGSTALECAKVLRACKPKEIHILTFAKSGA